VIALSGFAGSAAALARNFDFQARDFFRGVIAERRLSIWGDAMNAMTWAKTLAAIGAVLLIGCIVWMAREIPPPVTSIGCRDSLKVELADQTQKDRDNAGNLRIVGVSPKSVTLGSRLCVVVAGVAAAATEAQKPGAPPPASVAVNLFLNEEVTKLSAKAAPVPGPQMLTYQFGEHTDASSDEGKFWRGLLAGKTIDGVMALSVGVSTTQSSAPTALAPGNIDLVVYKTKVLAVGGLAMLILLVAFVVFAANSTVLRDTPDFGPNGPTGTYSLGRTQMALWLVLSVAGFIFLWLTLGFYLHVITTAVLVLLGINGATGLAAIVIDQPKTAAPAAPGAAAAAAPPVRTSLGFIEDLICDAEGAKLQRLQMVIWTCVLAVIFVWNVVGNFVFADFDTNLLLLMGIASSTYLGFKMQEK
jgi:hypothetical protein